MDNSNSNSNSKSKPSLPHFQQHQQQQAAMARFPSNIDAHLRPLGVYRPFFNPLPIPHLNLNSTSNPLNPNFNSNTINPSLNSNPVNPNLNSNAINPNLNSNTVNPNLNSNPLNPDLNSNPLNPNLNSASPITNSTFRPPKVNHAPSQFQPRPDVWRLHSDLKRPFDAPERDAVSDDAFFSVSDRKVRISDMNAVYALCRSWLRNGYCEESQFQPQHGDVLKCLPKPLPLPEISTPEKKETDIATDGKDENAAETLSAEELLQRHIKRAKRVRERLKEERMQRIKRYKSRLKLLLPPPMDQGRGDTGPS